MGLFSRRKKNTPDQVPPRGIEPGEQPIEPAAGSEPPAPAGTTDAGAPAPSSTHGASPGDGTDPTPPSGDVDESNAEPLAPVEADGANSEPSTSGDATPSIGISMSAFRGLGVPGTADGPPAAAPPAGGAPAGAPKVVQEQRQRGPAEAPAATESVAGLRDNVLLAQALAMLTEPPTAPDLMNVARQLLQGHVFLRVKGDARALLAEGKSLPLGIVSHGDKQFVLVYSGGAALQAAVRADGDTGTSAMGQPVLTVIRHVLGGPYEGIVVDGSSAPARAVLPRPLLQRALDEADTSLRVKSLLAGERTAATAAEVVAVLPDVPLWIAVRRSEADGAPVGVAESRTPEGTRYLEVFSHPLEMLALGRGDQALPIDASRLGAAIARDAGLSGVILDPAGPWIRLSRADLAPLLPTA